RRDRFASRDRLLAQCVFRRSARSNAMRRREFLRLGTAGLVTAGSAAHPLGAALARDADAHAIYNIRSFGAAGDGASIDSPAFNAAIAAAAAAGGGTVLVPPGSYLCHSIRLASFVTLHLAAGAVIVAAARGGYDAAESNAPFEPYQDFGHNHWHNS